MLNGCLPCYNLYATQDGRHLAVGSLEFKFWKAACEVFERPDWVAQHWQRGQMPGSPESKALRKEVAALVASQPLAYWAERFERADACVTPVLTLEEAQAHPLFAGKDKVQPWSAVA
jgi:crotonobetainyl-CoA:carnitine CoA-transferase CaiB-like acyl-CoA transferase